MLKGKHMINNKQKRAAEWVARFLRLWSSGLLCLCYALVYRLSLIGDMSTNKARTSDNAQQQNASNAVPIRLS